MDEPLRNALWSLLKVFCWDDVRWTGGMYSGYLNFYCIITCNMFYSVDHL